VLGNDLHRPGDAAEDMIHVVGKGDRKVASLQSGTIHRRLSCSHDRGAGHHPHRQNDHDADGDDFARDGPGAAAWIADGGGEHALVVRPECVIRARRR